MGIAQKVGGVGGGWGGGGRSIKLKRLIPVNHLSRKLKTKAFRLRGQETGDTRDSEKKEIHIV